MKRIALLTVLLLVVGLTAGFAVDVKPTVSLSGSATLTWAYGLDSGLHGFMNAADASFTLSLLAADGSDTHAGTGAAYGSITLANVEFYATDAGTFTAGPADGDITAKIVVTPFEIGVTTAPGFTQDFFGSLENADNTGRVLDDTESAYAMPGTGFSPSYGTWVKGTFGPAAVTLKVVSNGDWTANMYNWYAFGADAVLTFSPVTVSAGGYMGAKTSAYAKVALDMAPIVAWGGFEATLASTMTYGAGAGLTFTIVKDTTLAATMWYGDAYHGLDLKVVFTEPGDAGLVPMLDTTVTFTLLDVADANVAPVSSEWEAKLAAGYKVGLNSDNSQYARPFATLTYGSNTNDGNSDLVTAESVMFATAGVELQIIPLTLFTVQWVSGAASGADLASTTAALGSVQFITKVTY